MEALAARVAGEEVVVDVELRVEIEQDAFCDECLSPIGYVGVSDDALCLHVLEPFSLVQLQQEVFLVGCCLQASAVGEYYRRVLE